MGLHTWSFDRHNQQENLLPIAAQHNFPLLLSEFRGPKLASNPHCHLACGSETSRQDVYDAISYVQARYPVDPQGIFLLGQYRGSNQVEVSR